jgi:hypothetical protein
MAPRWPGIGTKMSHLDTDPRLPAGARPSFFLAVFQSWKGSRVFRVYPNPHGLLFIDAGPMVVFIDVETARRIKPGHWAIKAAGALKVGLVASVGGVFLVAAVLFRFAIRMAWDNPSQAVDFLTGIAMFLVFTVVLFILAVTSSVRSITKRVAHLDT